MLTLLIMLLMKVCSTLVRQLVSNKMSVKLEDYVHSSFQVPRHVGNHALTLEEKTIKF